MASAATIGLLCAGSVKYHPLRGGRSNGTLSRSELAGLLSGLNGPQMNLALASYMCDIASERKLIAHIQVWTAGLAIREQWFNEKWRVERGRPLICNMAAIAVFEVVRPNICKHCEGNGSILNRACSKCHGTGYSHLSGRKISAAIGIDECNFRRIWCGRYESVFRYVQDLDYEVNKHMTLQERTEEYVVCCAY